MKTGNTWTMVRQGVMAAVMAASATSAFAADLPSVKEPALAPQVDAYSPWFVRLGAAGVLFNSSASLTLGGNPLAGASARAGNNVTALIEAGYYFDKNFSVQFTGGVPPTAPLNGAGILSAFGKLGSVTYGPAVASVNYHLTNFGAFQPYVGIGGAYSIIFASNSGAVQQLNVRGGFGLAVQAGFDYYLNRNWSVFFDAKHLFLNVDASGNALGAPVTAVVRLDPTIISGGLSYHW